MKKIQSLIFATLVALNAAVADSVRFTENIVDSVVTVIDPDAGSMREVRTAHTGTLNASVMLPGLATNALPDETELSFSLGGISFNDTIGNADAFTANSVTFYITAFNANDVPVRVGSITFSRAGNVLSVSASSQRLEESFAAEDHRGESGRVCGTLPFSISAGELSKDLTLGFAGTVQHRTARAGSGDEAEEFELDTIQIAGSLDATKPALTVTKPLAGQSFRTNWITVAGTASDNYCLDDVLARRADEDDFASVEREKGVWRTDRELVFGTNLIQVKAWDGLGNETLVSRTVFLLAPVNVVIEPPTAGRTTGVTNGQPLIDGRSYLVTAVPRPGFLFSNWTGTVSSTNPALRFVMSSNAVLQANFVPNPFLALRGKYRGLFLPEPPAIPNGPLPPPGIIAESSEVTSTNSGSIELSLSEFGVASGRLMLAGKPFLFSNLRFDLLGQSRIQFGRTAPLPPLVVRLNLDLNNPSGVMGGIVSGGSWEAPLHAFLIKPVAGLAGRYTFRIPGGDPADTSVPAGIGGGMLTVTSNGLAALAGNLGDGTPLTAGSVVTSGGWMPIYQYSAATRGLLIGWARVEISSAGFDVFCAPLYWIKGALTPPAKLHPAGFRIVSALLGEKYVAPARGVGALSWSAGQLTLDGGNLSPAIVRETQWATNKLIVLSDSNQVNVVVNPSSGLLTGTFRHPATGRVHPLNGVVLQGSDGGAATGWFAGTNRSGFLDIRPRN